MPAFDWPLTLFTLITQLVLGAFAVLWVTDLLARQLAEVREQEYLTSVGVWLLGQPVFAYRALTNVATSWLSREILFLGGFFVLGAGYAALWWKRRELFALRAALGAVIGVIGGLGLASMIALYLLPAMPSWYQVSTPLSFVASALMLGPLLVATVFVVTFRWHGVRERLEPLLAMHLRYMVATVIAGAALAAVALGLALLRLPALGVEGEASFVLLTREHTWLLVGRVLLLVAGVVLLALLPRRLSRGGSVLAAAPMLYATLGVFLVSEVLDRLLFYATAVPLRPPGTFF